MPLFNKAMASPILSGTTATDLLAAIHFHLTIVMVSHPSGVTGIICPHPNMHALLWTYLLVCVQTCLQFSAFTLHINMLDLAHDWFL